VAKKGRVMDQQDTTPLHVLVKGQPGLVIGVSQFHNYVLVKFPDTKIPQHVHISLVDALARGAGDHKIH
jgi:hypothetical protein